MEAAEIGAEAGTAAAVGVESKGLSAVRCSHAREDVQLTGRGESDERNKLSEHGDGGEQE